jgi:ElaB/YqjD/DUF883 family membrane-anchored ribosome-binding protein
MEMENTIRSAENTIDHAVNGHGKKLSTLVGSSDEIMQYASDFANKFKGVSGDAIKESVSFAKRYPIHTALGAAAVGFFAGILVKRS